MQDDKLVDQFELSLSMAKFDKPKSEKNILNNKIDDFDKLLTNIKQNKWVTQILGSVVTVGNILNAQKTKLNRADGFKP